MALEMSIQGIGEFTDKVNLVSKKLPDMAITTIDRQSNRVVREYRKRVKPVKRTGNLSRGMRRMKAKPEKGDWVGGVKSYAPHFHLVEYGHKVVPIKSRKKSSKESIGTSEKRKAPGNATIVPGRYYLKKSLGSSESLFRKDVKDMVEKGMSALS